MTKSQAHSSIVKAFIRYYLDHGSIEAAELLGGLSRLMDDVDAVCKGGPETSDSLHAAHERLYVPGLNDD